MSQKVTSLIRRHAPRPTVRRDYGLNQTVQEQAQLMNAQESPAIHAYSGPRIHHSHDARKTVRASDSEIDSLLYKATLMLVEVDNGDQVRFTLDKTIASEMLSALLEWVRNKEFEIKSRRNGNASMNDNCHAVRMRMAARKIIVALEEAGRD